MSYDKFFIRTDILKYESGIFICQCVLAARTESDRAHQTLSLWLSVCDSVSASKMEIDENTLNGQNLTQKLWTESNEYEGFSNSKLEHKNTVPAIEIQ